MTIVEFDEQGRIKKLVKHGKVKIPDWQKKALKHTNEARRKVGVKKGEQTKQTEKPQLTAGYWENGIFKPY